MKRNDLELWDELGVTSHDTSVEYGVVGAVTHFGWSGMHLDLHHDEHGRLISLTLRTDAPADKARQITTSKLREVKVPQFSELAKSLATRSVLDAGGGGHYPRMAKAWVEQFTARGESRDDAWHARIAARYLELHALGIKNTNEVIAGELKCPTKTITNALFEARTTRRGLLTRVGQGRAGGELTDKARALLKEHNHGEH